MSLEVVKINRSEDRALKYLVFMINKSSSKKNQEIQEDDEVVSVVDEQDQNLVMKNASHII